MKVIPTIKTIISRLWIRKEYIPPQYIHKTHRIQYPKRDRYEWCGGYAAHKKWEQHILKTRGHWWGFESEKIGEPKEEIILDRVFRKKEKKI